MFKSGFITIIGRPNAGKSTLMNNLIGEEISIITKKAGTTRNQIKGIWNTNEFQAVFLDTPGLSSDTSTKLDKIFWKTAFKSIEDVDLIFYLISGVANDIGFDKRDKEIIETIRKKVKTNIVILISKIDIVESNKLDILKTQINTWNKDIKTISYNSFNSSDLIKIKSEIIDNLQEGEPYFFDDSITDMNDSFFISEIIRKSILENLSQELPHSINVKINELENKKTMIKIQADLLVERDSQKGMVIGSKGKMIKKIGLESRKKIEELYNKKVLLETRVKVKKNWKNDDLYLKDFKI